MDKQPSLDHSYLNYSTYKINAHYDRFESRIPVGSRPA